MIRPAARRPLFPYTTLFRSLAYTRMRKQDPKGDLGRNVRQQQVVKAIIKEGAKIQSITKLSDILDSLEDNVKTNLTLNEMKRIDRKSTRLNSSHVKISYAVF